MSHFRAGPENGTFSLMKGTRIIALPGRRSIPDRNVLLILYTASSMMIGCSRDESYFPLPEIDYYLVVTDSIGIELGDEEYMFAWASEAVYSPDGFILVSDFMKNSVFLYSPDGDFIRRIGGPGNGPGEFTRPSGIAFYPDGSFLVHDSDGLTLFDNVFNYVDQHCWDFSVPNPGKIVRGGGFVGTYLSIDPENPFDFVYSVGLWEPGQKEPGVTYCTGRVSMDMNTDEIDMSRNRGNGVNYCASEEGRVFYARTSIDEFTIHCCEPDGSEFLLIEDESVHRVRKSEEEVQAEIDRFMSLLPPNMELPEIRPDPYRKMIDDLFVDGEDRLWVRLGIHPGMVFRVYDIEGNVLFHAMVDYPGNQLDLNNWEITLDEYGILALSSSREICQRVYMMELEEAD